MEGPIFGGAYLRREIYFSKWIGLKVEFTVFALFYFVFEGNIPSTSPQRAHICRGDLTVDFLRYPFGGLIFGGGGKGGLYMEGLIFGIFTVCHTIPIQLVCKVGSKTYVFLSRFPLIF